MSDRYAYARLLTRVMHEEALSQGVDFVDPETDEKHEWSDEAWDILQEDFEEVLYAIELRKWGGNSFLVVRESDNPLAESKPFLRAYEMADVDSGQTYYYDDGTLQGVKITENHPCIQILKENRSYKINQILQKYPVQKVN